MPARLGAITGATAQAIVDVLLQRPLAERPRRVGELTRWQAFNTLWRQQWHPAEPEDRKVRWFAGIFSALWHIVFGILLLWFWYTQMQYIEEASKRRGEDVVQVEFIGRGAPEEVGGGETQEPLDETEAALAIEQAAAAQQEPETPTAEPPPTAVAQPTITAPLPQVEQRDVPEPQVPPTPPAQQDVAVSAPAPDASDFVLTAPTPRVAQPQIRVPQMQAPTAPLQAVEVPEPVQPIQREVAQRPIAAPQLASRIPEVAQREISAPVARPQLPQVRTPAIAQPSVRAPEATVRSRDVPTPSTRAPTAASSAAAPAATVSASSTTAATATTKPAASGTTPNAAKPSGAAPTTASSGQGPKPVTAPGGFPTPAKSDDWGASTRNVPGGQRGEPHGLYNAEGGPRLTERPINTGQPPGTLDDRIVDLDRSGTWLKRKPTDYEPTTFDKYWRPNETLLAEWVRKGIKKMAIPIPGTSKKIECVVSILALGGGCGISDPNLNDQPAEARPPPDIPFKPHLQEDNGSVKPKDGG
ncbi:hypothetical protein [Lysobacter solisilvae (ex Woo and Kim 2020)]|uniref:Transmembrane repetitive protein n=1 Tax=Agrilutibacter terrestris TaxID=2865112 RepID=A0A7H0FX64_9GAMM|nr:hypothetical protein [Lysobacter terrestris]QNP40630.1 hypothetical protein H8B22_14390 [Lysobacter terrestris]